MASATCFICVKNASIYIYNDIDEDGNFAFDPLSSDGGLAFIRDAARTGTAGVLLTGADWDKLPHTVEVNIEPSVDEGDEIRTDDTGGLKIKPCGDTIKYAVTVRSALCPEDWLYCYILADPVDPSSGALSWFAIVPNLSGQPAGPHLFPTDMRGTYFVLGKVNPGGAAFNNDETSPLVTEWSLNALGVVFPGCVVDNGLPGLRNVA